MNTTTPRFNSLEIVADGFQFPEGPVFLEKDKLLIADVKAGCIYLINTALGTLEKWVDIPGAPNGLALGCDQKTIYATDSLQKTILRIDAERQVVDLRPTTFLNGPNDLTIDPQGTIYFSDPTWQEGHEAIVQHVYSYKETGEMTSLGSFRQPNGIKWSFPYLFLAEGESGIIYRKSMLETRFIKFAMVQKSNGELSKALDGLEVDQSGTVYVAAYDFGFIYRFDHHGSPLAPIPLFPGAHPTNLALSPDEQFLYVTEAAKGQVLRLSRMGDN